MNSLKCCPLKDDGLLSNKMSPWAGDTAATTATAFWGPICLRCVTLRRFVAHAIGLNVLAEKMHSSIRMNLSGH
jgi:hypothetical protein